MNKARWYILLVLVLGLGVGLVFGVGAQPKSGGTLVMALGEEPDTLDPNETNRFHSLVVLNYVMEPLFALNEDFEAVPLLINSFEWSEDKLTMVVYLKKGIKFHNGQEMTSRDVKASYERYFRLSPLASYLPPEKGGIVEIETPDDYTVIFHFERAKPLALFYMADAHISIMPANWLAATPDEEVGVKSLIGTGPFQLVEWIRGDRIVMKRFEDYNHGPDFASNKGPAYMAIAHAVNKDEIAKAAWFGVGAPLYGLVGPATTGYWKGMPHVAYPHDLQKAKAYLDAAGWVDTDGNGVRDQNGKDLRLTLITFSNIDMWKRAGEIVQAQLAKVGIKVNIELAEVGAAYDRAESGDYDLGVFRNTWWMGVPYLTFLTHGDNIHSSNFGQLQNDALDTMLGLAGEELDDDLRKEAFYAAQIIVVESAVWIPLIANVNIVAAKQGVGGLDELFAHPWQPPILRALALYKK